MTYSVKWMPNAPMRPHRCAVFPQIGSSTTRKGFFDTQTDAIQADDRVYISVEAVELMASMLQWIPRNALSVAEERIRQRDARIVELEAELAEAARFRESAEYTLGQFGSKVKAKPGRKPAEKAVA